MFRVVSVNQQQMIYLVNLAKQAKVKSLGDFMSGSHKLVGEIQANEHEDVIQRQSSTDMLSVCYWFLMSEIKIMWGMICEAGTVMKFTVFPSISV